MNIWEFLSNVIEIVTWPYRKIKDYFQFKKRIKELRERDPFIYK